MSGARARANHCLYLARILIADWSRALEREQIPVRTLSQAYSGPVRDHLVAAYGWFLLEITESESLPSEPPHSCRSLPPPPEGKAMSGEVREFLQLESGGWLADLLEPRDIFTGSAARTPGTIAASAGEQLAPEEVASWADALESLFDRMGDSLDEY